MIFKFLDNRNKESLLGNIAIYYYSKRLKIKSRAKNRLFDQNRPDVLARSLDELCLENNNGGISDKIK